MTVAAMGHPSRTAVEHAEAHAAAQAELCASPYTALRHVRCCVSDGRIVLCGRVPSFYLKQMAQSVLLRRLGTNVQLHNHLEVSPAANEVHESPARGLRTA